jgi:hypothetical protein
MGNRKAKLMAFQQLLGTESSPGRRIALIDRAFRPPEPQLLDTCILQNLDWVDRESESASASIHWDEPAIQKLADRFGMDLALDLIDLGILSSRFENHYGYPWTVCYVAVEEAGCLHGSKGTRIKRSLEYFVGHQGDWTGFPDIVTSVPSSLSARSQLALPGLDWSNDGPLSFMPDRGDRLVVACALRHNIPAVLTTDRRTFWAHRDRLLNLGVEVMRPGELLDRYEPYWQLLDEEFARRHREHPRVVPPGRQPPPTEQNRK